MNPRISVVTPSLNQGQYIEQTIISVIGQLYPDFEYFIIDGGSTDSTIEILKAYRNKVTSWISEKDEGQAAAINTGFSKATGDILAWINSDDYYLPGIFNFIAKHMDLGEPQILIGNSIFFVEKSTVHWSSDIIRDHQQHKIELIDYIIQPSCFINKRAWEMVGKLNENYQFGFDWDFFIRCKKKGVKFKVVNEHLSIYRKHEMHKSGSVKLRNNRQKELIEIFNNYNSREDISLLNKLKGKTENLRQLEYYLEKIHLLKLYRILATLRYPSLFLKFKYDHIESIKKMFY